jgi:hypothetical protein
MRKTLLASLLSVGLFLFCHSANAQGSFGYTNGFGTSYGFGFSNVSWPTHYAPPARFDPRVDPSLIRAASIADHRAGSRSQLRCWHYVKAALLDAGAVRFNPTTAYANQAGEELVNRHGFVQLRIYDPYSAPIGAVLVYGGHGAGHVELRTSHGFASDYRSSWRCRYHLIGVYAKMTS